jgi:hypothetical protein
MRNYLIGILMPVLTLFFFSCKKSPADGGPYTFHNKMREPVNLSLYKTQGDYMYSRNALLSIRIPAQSNYTWRYTGGDGLFDKDAVLYLDWHTIIRTGIVSTDTILLTLLKTININFHAAAMEFQIITSMVQTIPLCVQVSSMGMNPR